MSFPMKDATRTISDLWDKFYKAFENLEKNEKSFSIWMSSRTARRTSRLLNLFPTFGRSHPPTHGFFLSFRVSLLRTNVVSPFTDFYRYTFSYYCRNHNTMWPTWFIVVYFSIIRRTLSFLFSVRFTYSSTVVRASSYRSQSDYSNTVQYKVYICMFQLDLSIAFRR